MSDSRRQYRAIKKAMKQLYPEELLAQSGNVPWGRRAGRSVSIWMARVGSGARDDRRPVL